MPAQKKCRESEVGGGLLGLVKGKWEAIHRVRRLLESGAFAWGEADKGIGLEGRDSTRGRTLVSNVSISEKTPGKTGGARTRFCISGEEKVPSKGACMPKAGEVPAAGSCKTSKRVSHSMI